MTSAIAQIRMPRLGDEGGKLLPQLEAALRPKRVRDVFHLGFSVYMSSGRDKCLEVIAKAKKAGLKHAFTSLHIPEEGSADFVRTAREVLDACHEADIAVMADIGPRTVQKMGLTQIEDLRGSPITHLRLDYGFAFEEVVPLSHQFLVVLNSSTSSLASFHRLKLLGADFSRFATCHNFYPKPRTGLSLERVKVINERLSYLGLTNMAFIPGDKELRGPLHQGLPTVEEHRNAPVLIAALQMLTQTMTDIVYVGDVDVTDGTWQKLQDLSSGFVRLRCRLMKSYEDLANSAHHDRLDSSEYVIRSVESRGYATPGRIIEPALPQKICRGDILLSNKLYLRYSGEIEIARCDIGWEERVNVIGYIDERDVAYLQYIRDGMGFILEATAEVAPI